MSWKLSAADKLDFVLTRTGGAKMVLRIAVFKDPQTPQQQRVGLLFMGAAPAADEVQTLPPLPPGDYQLVAMMVLEEAVSGTYDYRASLNGKFFAARQGDVNTSTAIDVESFVHRKSFSVV